MFTHLHFHTLYSALDALSDPLEAALAVAKDGGTALALTDHGTMAGIVTFSKACKEADIKPIFGMEAYMSYWDSKLPSPVKVPRSHLTILAKNKTGLGNLFELQRKSYSTGGNQDLTLNDLSSFKEGLIVTSGCLYGYIPSIACRHAIQTKQLRRNDSVFRPLTIVLGSYTNQYRDSAVRFAEALKKIMGDDFYIEVQDHGLAEQRYFNNSVAPTLAKRLNTKIVPTNDSHYVTKDEALAHSYISAIRMHQRGGTVRGSRDLHLKTDKEMEKLFPREMLDISNDIAAQIDDNVYEVVKHTPAYNTRGRPANDILSDKAWSKLDGMYGIGNKEAQARLDHELKITRALGFADYLLIVSDIVDETKRRSGEMPGPGRGSAAGSILSYLLGITDIDPLEHGLMFSRFISKARFTVDTDTSLDFGLNNG